jgi:primosomal protein N' (replication factor Y)
VALLSPPYSDLSYALPGYLPAAAFAVGQRVAIPLGNGTRVGIIRAFEDQAQSEASEAAFTIKEVLWPLERSPLLPPDYMDLIVQLAQRQTETPGRILGTTLPAGLRSAKARIRFLSGGKPLELRFGALAALPEDERERLVALWMSGKAELRRAGLNPLDMELCCLTQDPPWPVRPAAKAQIAMLEYLYEHGAVSRRKLSEALGKGAAATLSVLTARGMTRIEPAGDPTTCETDEELLPHAAENDESPGDSPNAAPDAAPERQPSPNATTCGFCLTEQQRRAYESLLAAARSGTAQTHLLFGITGSGKTAIYLELARAVLALGKSVLLLAPEVALALKLKADAEKALPLSLLPKERRHLFHGYQSPATREAIFLATRDAECGPRLVVGTRSALLLPLENIGLIVLDEEHDASFKQDEGLHYQAKEVAWYRAKTQKALLLLASATPDVKTFHAARQGLLPMHTLTERVGGGALPQVRLVTLPKGGATVQGEGLLAPESLQALRDVATRGEQAVILLNRRGYAPIMYCQSCSTVAKCPNCDISLAYHKGRERLVCHYCGWSVPYPSPCRMCGGTRFLPMGEGTEKIEESLLPHLPPGTSTLRLDRDSTRRPGRMEEILKAFARKEASVLVGTQMLSKGHHFPDVTLAVVADADLGLNLPDYRAAERTFQLLLQSAGRSGRGSKPGQVLIQTRDPAHYCWDYVMRADYEGFYQREVELRQRRFYPPFVRLALIRVSYAPSDERASGDLASLGLLLRSKARELGVTLLGPAPAPLPMLKGRLRFHCLLKGRDWPPLRELYNVALAATRKTGLSLRLDLDPMSML